MTHSAKPVPPARRDDDQPAEQGSADPVDRGAPAGRSLVWPPPEHELESWEVIQLAPPAESPASGAREGRSQSAPGEASWAAALDAGKAQPADHPHSPAGVVSNRPARVSEVQGLHAERADVSTGRWRVPAWLTLAGMLATGGAGYFAASLVRPASPATPTTATLLIETLPPGARVLIDGTLRGKTPLRIEVSPGARRVAVESPAGRRETELQLKAGANVERFYDLAAPTASQTGILEVQTQPPGAHVVVAGEPRGTTPVTIRGLAPGLHDVLISAGDRSVTRRVSIGAGRVASLLVPMTAIEPVPLGSLTATSTLPLRIEEGGRVLGSTDGGRPQLSGGLHDLEFVNDEYGLRLARTVNIVPGRDTAVALAVPPGQVSVNATPWAEVFADGRRLGETPIGNVSLPVGPHELVFRHPQLGERRQTIHVRAGTPTRVAVNLSQ